MKKVWNLIKENWDWILIIALALCIRSTHILAINRVDGQSMMPTLTDGQFTFGSSLASYDRGDIVIIQLEDGKLLVKRIIGLPGETIKSKDGKIYINDVLLDEDYIEDSRNQYSSQTNWVTKLGDDEYFCMGDNRDNSADSRYYGAFTKEQLIEKLYLY